MNVEESRFFFWAEYKKDEFVGYKGYTKDPLTLDLLRSISGRKVSLSFHFDSNTSYNTKVVPFMIVNHNDCVYMVVRTHYSKDEKYNSRSEPYSEKLISGFKYRGNKNKYYKVGNITEFKDEMHLMKCARDKYIKEHNPSGHELKSLSFKKDILGWSYD